MSYYLVVFIRKINSLCFTTNVFLSNSYRIQEGSFVCIYSFRSHRQRYSLKKDVVKNFAKFLKTPFLHNVSEQLLLSFINDTHREKLVLYRIQYKNSLQNKVGCLLSYRCLKNVIHQIDSKNEWFLFSVTFTAKFDLVFVLKFENAFS